MKFDNISNTVMNNWDDFFGKGWSSYSDPDSLGGKFEAVAGLKHWSRGWGKNTVSATFSLSTGLELVLQLKKYYGKINIDVYSKVPCYGLPLESDTTKVIDTVKVADDDVEIAKALVKVAKAVSKAKTKVAKDLGKVAQRNGEAKTAFLMWD